MPSSSDITPPSVSITSPASGTTYTTSQTVVITASASDTIGGVTKVEFYGGATLKGVDTTSGDGFTFSWSLTSANNGTHSWTAKAYDAANNSKVSLPISLTVNIAASSATDYYVATTGNDSVSCVQAKNISTPKRTLNNAVTCLTPGATLYIMRGTYAETLHNNIPGGTSWSQPVTVAAFPGQAVTIQAQSRSGPGPAFPGTDHRLHRRRRLHPGRCKRAV